MTLPASGQISLSQVNTELGRSSTATISLGETAVRSLAGVSSGAIAMSDLYGKSNSESHTVTVGEIVYCDKYSCYTIGYGWQGPSTGAVSPDTFAKAGGTPILELYWLTGDYVIFSCLGNLPNSGWTTMTVNGTTFNRASASYNFNGVDLTTWTWSSASNAFGTSIGANKTVVFV